MGLKKQHSCFFKVICNSFLENHKSENYLEIVNNLLSSYKVTGCNMSLKIHFLDSHLDFLEIRISSDISDIKQLYQGKWGPAMLADYCWTLKRDVSDENYSGKSYICKFFK